MSRLCWYHSQLVQFRTDREIEVCSSLLFIVDEQLPERPIICMKMKLVQLAAN